MRAFVVDAFTDVAFRGNPAGVVLLDQPADAAWMQAVAAEFKHAETAFVRVVEDGYDLRWFTPLVEVDLCGHATLAASHALATSGSTGPFTFHTRSGDLHTDVDGGVVTMDFPAAPVVEVTAPAVLAPALGSAIGAVHRGGDDLLVDLADEDAVRGLAPDIGRLAQIECRGVIVTAPGESGDHDFVSRFFAPRVGVDEDPVTGSAHCALGPLWSRRLGRDDLVGVQVSARGGRVAIRTDGDRVELRGHAVTVLQGDLLA